MIIFNNVWEVGWFEYNFQQSLNECEPLEKNVLFCKIENEVVARKRLRTPDQHKITFVKTFKIKYEASEVVVEPRSINWGVEKSDQIKGSLGVLPRKITKITKEIHR